MAGIHEQTTERTLGLVNNGAEFQGTRTFICTGFSGERFVIARFGGGGLPALGDEHPDQREIFACEYSIRLITGHNDVWEVKFTYKSSSYEEGGGGDDPSDPITPTTPGFVEITTNTLTEFIPIYRNNPDNLPIEGMPTGNPEEDDIGGTPAVYGGAPVSAANYKIEINVGVVERYTDIHFQNITQFVGQRLSKTLFFGGQGSASTLSLPAHKTLYIGANTQRTGVNLGRVNHRFIIDERFHCRFVSYRNLQGEEEPEEADAAPRIVYPVQPFPNLFNALLLSVHF